MGGSKGLCGVVLKSDIGDGRVRLVYESRGKCWYNTNYGQGI